MSKNDVIVVNDVKELEKLDKKDRVVIEDMTGKNREDLIEYIKDESKFLDLLYLLNEKEDIEKLIKMRLVSGRALPIKNVLLRNEKLSIKGNFRYKKYDGANYESYVHNPMISAGEFKISKILDKIDEKKDSFLNSMIDNSLTNFNIVLSEKTGELFFYGIKRQYKENFNDFSYRMNSYGYFPELFLEFENAFLYIEVKKMQEKLLETKNGSEKDIKQAEIFLKELHKCNKNFDTFVIEIEDNPKLIESITDAVYERNQKEREARNYFNI